MKQNKIDITELSLTIFSIHANNVRFINWKTVVMRASTADKLFVQQNKT